MKSDKKFDLMNKFNFDLMKSDKKFDLMNKFNFDLTIISPPNRLEIKLSLC